MWKATAVDVTFGDYSTGLGTVVHDSAGSPGLHTSLPELSAPWLVRVQPDPLFGEYGGIIMCDDSGMPRSILNDMPPEQLTLF